MTTRRLERPFGAAGMALRTEVLETVHKMIARVLDADREVFAVSLDRTFVESPEGHAVFGQAPSPEWLADQAERAFLQLGNTTPLRS